ncbi:MAG: hypothetical protein ACYDBV_08255 [Nitrospiria bacterium]
MWPKIKILLFYAVIIDAYVYYFGKGNPLAPFYGLLTASLIFIPGFLIVRKVRTWFNKKYPLRRSLKFSNKPEQKSKNITGL